MHLYVLPILFVLAGLVLYTVLGGADFGAGMWQLTAGGGERGEAIRDHAHEAMAPVWEANHVWLIFVLTVFWTCFPRAFGAIFTALAVPLSLAGLGIVLRGATYALRGGATTGQESRRIDTVFAVSSFLTPFALGSTIGAIASGRARAGSDGRHLISSWVNAPALTVGVIAVLACAYLASVYLAADATRRGEPDIAGAFRTRALGAGIIAGGAAIGGLVIVHADARHLYHGLTTGAGLAVTAISIIIALAALGSVARSRFEAARYLAAAAVALIVAAWAIAQEPVLIPGLRIAAAAAPHTTLLLVVIAVLAGGFLLFPSLSILFALLLSGTLTESHHGHGEQTQAVAGRSVAGASPRAGHAAGAALVAGSLLVVFATPWWAQLVGVLCLLAFMVLAFHGVGPALLAERPSPAPTGSGHATQPQVPRH